MSNGLFARKVLSIEAALTPPGGMAREHARHTWQAPRRPLLPSRGALRTGHVEKGHDIKYEDGDEQYHFLDGEDEKWELVAVGPPVGSVVYYTGQNQTFPSGDKVVHGQAGLLGQTAGNEARVKVLFPANKCAIVCRRTDVRRLRSLTPVCRLVPELAHQFIA